MKKKVFRENRRKRQALAAKQNNKEGINNDIIKYDDFNNNFNNNINSNINNNPNNNNNNNYNYLEKYAGDFINNSEELNY